MKVKERTKRQYQSITDPVKLKHLIEKFFLNKRFFIKESFNKTLTVESIEESNQVVVSCESELEEIVLFYRIFNKYMEVNSVQIETRGPNKFLLAIKEVKIAVSDRENPRGKVTIEDGWINNIRASKNTINASLMNIPTTVKVHFSQYQNEFSHLADEVVVDVFDKTNEKHDLVRKSGKVLYIEDTSDVLSYQPENEEMFIDYRQHIHTDINQVINGYKDKKIISEVIVPIIYVGHDGKDVPLGFIQLISKSEKIDLMKILDLKAKTFEIVDRIRDSNTMLINTKQEILNISRGGLQLRISDEELKKFLVHRKGFSFDVIFKLQQPITVFTEILYTGFDRNNDLIIGIKYFGRSSRHGEWDRLMSYADNSNQ